MSVVRAYLRAIRAIGRDTTSVAKDESQMRVAERLDTLLWNLGEHKRSLAKYVDLLHIHESAVAAQARDILQLKRDDAMRLQRASVSAERMPSTSGSTDDRTLELDAFDEARRLVGCAPPKPTAPKSVYIHGNVGAGKTFLMDIFYRLAGNELNGGGAGARAAASTDSISTCRLHYNTAMMELHRNMHRIEQSYVLDRNSGGVRGDPAKLAVMASRRRGRGLKASPSSFTVSDVLQRASHDLFLHKTRANGHLGLICFDEMQVPDAFTAIAIMSMFRVFFQEEAVVVCTSNRAPHELNDNAWFQEHYDKFVELFHDRCDIVNLQTVDYRRKALRTAQAGSKEGTHVLPYFFHPATNESAARLDNAIEDAARMYDISDERRVADEVSVKVMFGRRVALPCIGNRIVRLNFTDFFSKAIGPTDCIAIANSFLLVCIDDIPILNRQKRDQARRFITLVDELYNERKLLVCTAAASPDELFVGDELADSLLDLELMQFEGEALVDAKLRTESHVAGGISPDAMTQRMASDMEDRKEFLKKMGGEEEQFAFQRAVSRIVEMQSEAYLEEHRARYCDGFGNNHWANAYA